MKLHESHSDSVLSIWCSTVSKTFSKYTKTPKPIFPLSRVFLIFSVILFKALDVLSESKQYIKMEMEIG